MRYLTKRKVTPRVKDGVVQKKQRRLYSGASGYVIDRESPARGHRHMITKQDVRTFISLIPNWVEHRNGIELIILSARGDFDGLYETFRREKTGTIEIPAWAGDLWRTVSIDYFREHEAFFKLVGVAWQALPDDEVECRFTKDQARAFLLLHVFLHELGHHVDRITTKNQDRTPRGEPFAEEFANRLLHVIWPDYIRVFGNPNPAAKQ
jgi:hypothetical protein